MHEAQFATDTYRLYAAVHRVCRAPADWYHSGASQKYLMRQLKTMDFVFLPEGPRKNRLRKSTHYLVKDSEGRAVVNTELDVGLLVVYGQTLYQSASYHYALSRPRAPVLKSGRTNANHDTDYFYRALTLDPENPFLFLQMGLCYLYHGMKRQVEDRHHSILEAFSFLQRYRDAMRDSPIASERQAAEFNMARAFHVLGT